MTTMQVVGINIHMYILGGKMRALSKQAQLAIKGVHKSFYTRHICRSNYF